jgi:hypothetical protein
MPGTLQSIRAGVGRNVTAGGVIFLPVGTAAAIANAIDRPADALALTVREVA